MGFMLIARRDGSACAEETRLTGARMPLPKDGPSASQLEKFKMLSPTSQDRYCPSVKVSIPAAPQTDCFSRAFLDPLQS